MKSNVWKLQDAKSQFSEVVRRARSGEPQEVTVHGKRAVAVADLDRFEVRRKRNPETAAGLAEASAKYRLDIDFDFDSPLGMHFPRSSVVGEGEPE
jgi:prevent-host-death family protein